MKQKLYSLFLTAFFGMLGVQVWAQDLTTTEIDGVTYYEIGNAADLVAFAELVNGGEFGANAILTADIDMTGIADTAWVAIGDWHADGISYKAHFNGQGHTIKNFNFTATHNYFALFGIISTGALVENFTIEGSITVDNENFGYVAGIAAYIRDKTPTIRNVHSKVDINSTSTAGTPRLGGIAGGVPGQNSTAIIDKCTYSGTLNANDKGGNYGGIVGYILNNANVTADITSCLFDGKIQSQNTASSAQLGGIIGYTRKGIVSVKNCLSVGTFEFDEADVSNVGQFVGRITYDSNTTGLTFTNNFYKNTGVAVAGSSGGVGNGDAPVEATAEQFASGEVCYLLNGDQEVISFYQMLDGSDEYPVLDATHKQVFMNGRLHCNGNVYEGATFSNEDAGVIQDEHDFVDGFCSYCGLFDENYLTPNADGFYELSTAKHLIWFEQLVNKGTFEANAILTADIDFEDVITEKEEAGNEFVWTPIGDWGQIRGTSSAGYKGHFDGQGHKILNFNVTSICNYYGIFGVVSSGSLIENFDIYGTLNLGHKTGGVVGYTRDATCTIRNIHSYITLNVTEAATTAERPGGIVGSAVNGTTIIENCTYSGTLNAGEHTGNIGGIVGYVNNNSAAIVNITNCLFDGEIQNGTSADGQCGGIVGYNNGGTLTVRNCLSIGEIVSSNGNIGQFIGRLNGSNTTFANNYYVGEFVNGTLSGKTAKGTTPVKVTTDDLASGEICWKLNEETFIDPVWKQTLGDENYPKPYGNGAIVYQTPDGYDCIDPNEPETFNTFRDGIIANETEFLENTIAYQVLVDDYESAILSWQDIDNLEEFLEAYQATAELKDSIKQSAANYATYIQTCANASSDLETNHLEGATSDILKTYLQEEEEIEPGEAYPNGNYAYIMENRNLDDEAILAEIAFVNQMLEDAIMNDGIRPGNEVTRLLTNPSFAEGFEGWTKESNGPTLSYGGTTSVMPIVRGLGNGTFDVSQTLTEMPNGIYMMTANGMFRSGSDVTSQFYAGQLYMNGTGNYIMSPGESVVLDADTIPGENCGGYKTDARYEVDDIEGYVPNNMNGCSYFFNSGHYQNYCATEVTDGELTIGVRSLGTGLANDWLPFSNVHLTYLGTAEEANETLTNVLNEFAARAQVILDCPIYDYDQAAEYPNISESLREQLSDAITDVEEATTGALKMDLINIFSDLFLQVHECRKAYIEMVNAATSLFDFLDVLLDAEIITEDEYWDWDAEISAAFDHFVSGDVTTAQAQEITQRLKVADQLLPQVDGKYQLATTDQLKLFSLIVNNGASDLKAVLVDDIDMSTVESFEPIGSSSKPFMGEFDGQGHKISNFGQFIVEDEETGEGYYTLSFSGNKIGEGFFGSISGATVKNFSIEGAFEVTGGNYKGAIGLAQKSTVSNVHSYLDIAVTVSGCHHCGGVVGSTEGDAGTTISGCSFNGTLTVAAGSTDNFAGILGYSGGDAVWNCANYGTVTFADAGCAAGGIVGYINNTTTYIQNCLNVGVVKCEANSPKYGGAIIGRIKNNWSSERVVNNYWLEGSAYGPARKDDGSSPAAASANGSTAWQLKSGEICYKLNGDQTEINWYQTLNTDEYPVLFPTSAEVFYSEANDYYYNLINGEVGIKDVSTEQPTFEGIFNLAGQRLSKMQKGINIVNGKKIFVK